MFTSDLTAAVTLSLIATLFCPAHATAGALPGPQSMTSRVSARGTGRSQPIRFEAGRQATVTVKGDGDTDLDLYVYDSRGNLVASDDNDQDECAVTWTPRLTGNFYIVVLNRGTVYNSYVLRTN